MKKKFQRQQKPTETAPELEQEVVKAVGHGLSVALKELIAKSPEEDIKDALTILRTATNVKNKAGYFRTALEKRFKPSSAKSEKKLILDPDFDEWFRLLKQKGLALGSEQINGELWIHSTPGQPPTLYGEMRSMFSLAYLKRVVGGDRSKIRQA